MALYREAIIVGQVPHNLAPILSAFLRRDNNKAFAKSIEELAMDWRFHVSIGHHINCCWTSLNSYTSIVVVASLTIQITVGVVKILSGCGFGRC